MLDQKIAEEGTKRGFHVLDAPVTGGDTGAKNGTLSILVGGSKDDYEACMPLFEAMGTNINYQGGSGCGQHAKLANQIMIARHLIRSLRGTHLCEGKRPEPSDRTRFRIDRSGGQQTAGYLRTKDPGRRLRTGILPEALRQRHETRLTEANMSNLNLDVLSQVLANYELLQAEGCGDLGTQALIKYYEEEMDA